MGVRSGNSGQTMKVEATGSTDGFLHVEVRGGGNLRFPSEPHTGRAASRRPVGEAGTT